MSDFDDNDDHNHNGTVGKYGELLDEEHDAGLTIIGDGDWHDVCVTSYMLPEIDKAGLDVCFDDGRPAVLVYATCSPEDWNNGVDALTVAARLHGFTVKRS